MPDIRQYYKADILATVIQTNAKEEVPQWLEMKASWACPKGLSYLFWIPHTHRKVHPDVPPTTRLLLKNMGRFQTTMGTKQRVGASDPP
ncbi:Hypothetical predicted protein, partial [Pelobates cultripes]